MRAISLFVATLFLSVAAVAQCKGCCKDAPAGAPGKPGTAHAAATAGAKAPAALLYNDVCPVTGRPAGATSPTLEFQGYRISLCCAGCRSLFAALGEAKQRTFLANYTGKKRRTGFSKSTKDGTPAVAKSAAVKSDCC
ncbi:MAG: hypothetical protein KDC87_07990, partial [Planctomycetes bacterium]|nr:hypothetical protein [Planctomycetota bacterium]